MTRLNGKPVWWPDRRSPDGLIDYLLPGEVELEQAVLEQRAREAQRQLYQLANHPARKVRQKVIRAPADERTAAAALARLRSLLTD